MPSSTFNSRYLLAFCLKGLIGVVIFVVVTHWILPGYYPAEKWRRLNRERDQIVALALGDSTGVALQFDQLGQNGFTLFCPSVSVEMELMRAHMVLRKLPAVHTVYYLFSPNSLLQSTMPRRDYLEDMPVDLDAFAISTDVPIHAVTHRTTETLLLRRRWAAVRAYRLSSLQHISYGIARTGHPPWSIMAKNLQRWPGRNLSGLETETARNSLKLLRQFAAELETKGIRLVLVRLPINPLFAQGLPHYPDFTAQCRALARLPNVRFYDLSTLCDDRPANGPNVYFSDIFHVNQTGAAKVTGRLRELLAAEIQ